VATHGDTLTADCRRTDGSWGTTALRSVDRCVGDIGNMDGQLACNGGQRGYGGPRDRDYGERQGYRYGYGPNYDRGPGYGSSDGYQPPAGYPTYYGR
jgi:hypothetical protein